MPSTRKVQKSDNKILEASVEGYFVRNIEDLGGFAIKNNANWYGGIPDRTVGVLGYMCMVECKRPKGGRLSVRQKFWKKFLDDAGVPWHLIYSKAEVDEFVKWVMERYNGIAQASCGHDKAAP